MKTAPASPALDDAQWHGPGAPGPGLSLFRRLRRSWKFGRRERSRVTLPGTLLVLLTLGIGTAAYNAANNLLFLALSLLLASLILSGILSSLNFLGCAWRFGPMPPARVGEPFRLEVHLRNNQRFLPLQALFVDVVPPGERGAARLYQATRLDPGATQVLSLLTTPLTRGRQTTRIIHVGSFFPFGFLRKGLLGACEASVLVRPGRVEYQGVFNEIIRKASGERTLARPGRSGDLLALRPYRSGDSHREIHWKATARTGRLVVRTFTTEAAADLILRLSTSDEEWNTPALFEKMCALAGTLAEDLLAAGKIAGYRVDDGATHPLRSSRELEAFLDRLAELASSRQPRPQYTVPAGEAELTLHPASPSTLAVRLHGELVATA